jgi:hypothetical protein
MLVLLAATMLLGCPNPNTYGTPRTTPAGKLQHTLAAEVLHETATFSTRDPGGMVSRETATETVPLLPTYQLRVGLAERVDIGVRLSNVGGLGADVKWNFVRSELVDLAVDPKLHAHTVLVWNRARPGGAVYVHLPLMLGLNLARTVTVVAVGGPAAGLATGQRTGGPRVLDDAARGVALHAGLGAQLRASRGFALHPEVGAMRFFSSTEDLVVVVGLGFTFGAIPSYVEDSASSEAAPAP